jgi:hypothetical protein
MAPVDQLHTRLDALLGSRIGYGISREVIARGLAANLAALNNAPTNWVPIGAIPLGVQLLFRPATHMTYDRNNQPFLECVFGMNIVDKTDVGQIFRHYEVAASHVPLQLATNSSGRMRFSIIGSIDPVATPSGPPDQKLIDKYYKGSVADYLAHETAIVLNLPAIVATFVAQIPFPDFPTHMHVFTLGSVEEVFLDSEYFIIAAKAAQIVLPGCIQTASTLKRLEVSTPSIDKEVLSRPKAKESRTTKFAIEHRSDIDIGTLETLSGIEAFLYYAKPLTLDIAAGSIATKIALKEKAGDESFFVRWWYQFSAAIESATVSFDLAKMLVKVNARLTGDGTASGTIKIGCVDIISEVVAIDGRITLELSVGLDRTSSPNFKDVRLGAKLVASSPQLTVSGFPFPLNLVLNLILSLISQSFGRKTVAEFIAHFELPLLDTEEAFTGIPQFPWIARQHLTAASQLITLSLD